MFANKHFHGRISGIALSSLLAAVLFGLPVAKASEAVNNRVDVFTTLSAEEALPGMNVILSLELDLEPEAHANSNRVANPELIPTTFFPTPSEGIEWGRARYPKPTHVIEWYSVDPMPVFQDGAVIRVPVTVSEDAESGPLELEGKLKIQICDSEACYPPKRVPVQASLTVMEP